MDTETDKKITEIIRSEFSGSSVITVAHRLATVLHGNKVAPTGRTKMETDITNEHVWLPILLQVVVLERGKVLEAGTPQQLLSDPQSSFYKLASSAGITME